MQSRDSRIVVALSIILGLALPIVAHAQVNIDTVFGPTCTVNPSSTSPPAPYIPGSALHLKTVDLATFPAARCNDGSAAAYYVHRASDPADEDKWVIYLEGGFSCNDFEGCRDRWCGENQPAADLNAQKMSSQWLPTTIGGAGILHSAFPNGSTFSSWNHVLIHYCSSDRWSGRQGQATLTDGASTAVINFRGRNIVRAVVLELMDAAGVTADDGHAMPSLSDAATVLWTGTSAGGAGAVQSANSVRDAIAAASPNVDFRLIVDGAYAPSDPLWDATLAALAAAEFPTLQSTWNVQLDPACEADNPGARWTCTINEVLLNYVAFPFFVRQDLSDNVVVDALSTLVGATEVDVIAATVATLLALNGVANASYYGSCTPAAGHVWLTTALRYRLDALSLPSPPGATNMDAALAEWLATGGPVTWYDVPLPATGLCPP